MKKVTWFLLVICTVSFIFYGCGTKSKNNAEKEVSLTISAAASLKEVLNEVKADFEKENKNIKLNINFGASGDLRAQIEKNAPVDIFISADSKNFDKLVTANLADKDTRTQVTSNSLCLVFDKKNKDNIKDIKDITKDVVGKISIGTPETVPAGNYAKQSLEHYNIFKNVESKIVYGNNVKTVLSYVEKGNVDCGAVFLSDTKSMADNLTYILIDDSSHKPIEYIGGVISSSTKKEQSKKLLDYLTSKKGKDAFNKYGFLSK